MFDSKEIEQLNQKILALRMEISFIEKEYHYVIFNKDILELNDKERIVYEKWKSLLRELADILYPEITTCVKEIKNE
jgi:hypothetical protein